MLTDRDFAILLAVAKYYVLDRPQIQRLCVPSDNTGRVTRRRLQALVSAGLLNRHRAGFAYPSAAPVGSVYYPSARGCELLAEHMGDDQWLLTPTQCPQPHHVLHWLAVSETHIRLDQAIGQQSKVSLAGWINEWDIVNKDESEPAKRFRLYTLLRENPKLVCAPDAAFLLEVAMFKKVFYVEQDRATSGAMQVAASKCKGYAELTAQRGHAKHFSDTNVDTFTVLCVVPNARRREALRRAFSGKVGSDLWKFVADDELSAESFLHAPILYPVHGDPIPLVKPDVLQE